MRLGAGLPSTDCVCQVVATCAEAARLLAVAGPVLGGSSLMSWLTDCPLSDGAAWDDLGLGEEAVEGYGSPEALAAVTGTLPLALSFGVLSPAGKTQTVAGGLGGRRGLSSSGELLFCLPCTPATGSLQELSHQAAPRRAGMAAA